MQFVLSLDRATHAHTYIHQTHKCITYLMDRCSICFFFFFIACLCLYAVPRIRQLASKSMNVPNGKAVAAQAAISPALYSLARNLVGNLSVRSLFTVECHLFFFYFSLSSSARVRVYVVWLRFTNNINYLIYPVLQKEN